MFEIKCHHTSRSKMFQTMKLVKKAIAERDFIDGKWSSVYNSKGKEIAQFRITDFQDNPVHVRPLSPHLAKKELIEC